MRVEQQKADLELPSKGIIHLQDQYLGSIMDVSAAKNSSPLHKRNGTPLAEGYRRTFSQGNGKRIFSASYFSVETMLLLVCLTATLLLLPLILPPLPPPPLPLLLLLPICILAVLMVLAFMPSSNVRDATTYTYL